MKFNLTSLLNKFYLLTLRKKHRLFLRALQYPDIIQRKILVSIVSKNQNTEYGKRFRFDTIKSIPDYQDQVPIVTYEDIEKDIKIILSGKSAEKS